MNFSTPLFTIGYEGLNSAQFFEILQAHNVQHLIDVRAIALSRKAGFSKTALGLACHDAQIEYTHIPSLGCPNDIRASYRLTGDWQEYTRHFLSYLATRDSDVDILLELSQNKRCALLCFEADANFCHRLYIAQAVQKISCGEIEIYNLNRNSIVIEESLLLPAGK